MTNPINSAGSARFLPDMLAVAAVAAGVAAALMFSYTDLLHNAFGTLLMILFAWARKTRQRRLEAAGQVTHANVMLDRWTAYISFFFIYLAICLRVAPQAMPGTITPWGFSIYALCAAAAFLCHSPQAHLRYYYRQVHHWWAEGKALAANASMEKHTPSFQQLRHAVEEHYGNVMLLPDDARQQLVAGSEQLQQPAILLSFEVRALVLSLCCIAGLPWCYPLFEIVVLCCAYIYMHKSHEHLCADVYRQITQLPHEEHAI